MTPVPDRRQRTSDSRAGPRDPARQRDSEHRWRMAGLGSLAVIAALMLASVQDYGLIWDEELHSTYGEHVLAWFESGFQDDRALRYKNLYLYGALFDVLAQLFARVSPLDLYDDRHLVNVGFGLLALAGTWRLGALILGARGGSVAMALTALTPMFYGHSFNNPKDIPFAAVFVWAVCFLYESARPLPGASTRAATKLALAFGVLLAIRPGGIFFLVYIVLWWSIALWRARFPNRALTRALAALALVMLAAWVLMLSVWPWGQVNPIVNPLRGIKNAARFSFTGTTLFLGEQIPAQDPPLSYLPAFFALQLPETYLVAAAAGMAGYVCAARQGALPDRERRIELAFLGYIVLFPIATAMVLRSTLYDGVRHFLFVIPPLAVLAAAGLESGLRAPVPRAVRASIVCLAVLAAVLTMREMIALHPYQSIYFNRLVAGGLPGASGRFETDYWGNSYREAVEWVVKHVPGEGIRIANCSYPLQSSYYLRGPEGARFIPVSLHDNPDVLLATTRWDCHRKTPGRVLHVVERQGVPLAYVLDLRR